MGDFGNTFWPIAQKEHRCEWCYWPIQKGEKHALYKGMHEGDWQNWRMHEECLAEQQHLASIGEPDFSPGCADPPERIKNQAGNKEGKQYAS